MKLGLFQIKLTVAIGLYSLSSPNLTPAVTESYPGLM